MRSYEDRPIDEAALNQILEAGRRTPSSSNKQRWDFVVVQDRDRLRELAKVWQGARHIPSSAVTIALVGPDSGDPKERESIAYDMGQLTMSIMIAAADLGIGTGHSSAQDQEVARQILGFPEGHRLWWMIGLGYPADRALQPLQKPDRRPLQELVHHETW